jgi:hypothetical protein
MTIMMTVISFKKITYTYNFVNVFDKKVIVLALIFPT